MNVNFGLFPNLSEDDAWHILENGKRKRLKGKDKKKAYSGRALAAMAQWTGKTTAKAA